MLFLSIKPKYVKKILDGEKRVELRRRKPRSVPGDWIAIYATIPSKSLVAVAQISEIKVSSPQLLWGRVKHDAGVEKHEYDEYFQGANQAVGIVIIQPKMLFRPLPLDELRVMWPQFNPPQGFLYLSDQQTQQIFGFIDERRRAA
ncbi:MAG: hypothetical protein CME32_31575 [Gimesia sp.]|nr:hypothetical protein [Gimesia sp.]